VKQNKGLFGLSKPEFGNYKTVTIGRSNSSVIKKKTKDSTQMSWEVSSAGIDIDDSKFLTVEKNKEYQLKLATVTDTIEAVFSISSVAKEKKQTFLGKMLSKNDEGKDITLSYDRDISGIIKTGSDAPQWEFFIEHFSSGSRITANNFIPSASITSDQDSLYFLYPDSMDIILVNKRGHYYGALKYKQKPLSIWIRNDIENSYQKVIAALFAVIISIKDL
jgi:hypothetical protein